MAARRWQACTRTPPSSGRSGLFPRSARAAGAPLAGACASRPVGERRGFVRAPADDAGRAKVKLAKIVACENVFSGSAARARSNAVCTRLASERADNGLCDALNPSARPSHICASELAGSAAVARWHSSTAASARSWARSARQSKRYAAPLEGYSEMAARSIPAASSRWPRISSGYAGLVEPWSARAQGTPASASRHSTARPDCLGRRHGACLTSIPSVRSRPLAVGPSTTTSFAFRPLVICTVFIVTISVVTGVRARRPSTMR